MAVFSSFFLNNEVSISFDQTTGNITDHINGSFVGISSNTYDGINQLLQANLFGGYGRDCSNSEAEVDFFTVFGVVFSGVTGIMAGANLSGELIRPSKSIPSGTLSACGLTYSTFIVLSLMTALTCDQTLLLYDCIYMIRFTWWKGFILIGNCTYAISDSWTCLFFRNHPGYLVSLHQ